MAENVRYEEPIELPSFNISNKEMVHLVLDILNERKKKIAGTFIVNKAKEFHLCRFSEEMLDSFDSIKNLEIHYKGLKFSCHLYWDTEDADMYLSGKEDVVEAKKGQVFSFIDEKENGKWKRRNRNHLLAHDFIWIYASMIMLLFVVWAASNFFVLPSQVPFPSIYFSNGTVVPTDVYQKEIDDYNATINNYMITSSERCVLGVILVFVMAYLVHSLKNRYPYVKFEKKTASLKGWLASIITGIIGSFIFWLLSLFFLSWVGGIGILH